MNVLLRRGSLTVGGPRELLVDASFPAAYRPDGAVDPHCVRTTSTVRDAVRRTDPAPSKLGSRPVVRVDEEEVVWGANLSDHFGHFLTESVGRLWPLLPGGELAGLPVVFSTPNEAAFVRDWLEAFGVRTVDLPERGAVRFTSIYVPEPAWQVGAWIAPEFRDIHLHARRGLDVPAASSGAGDVLWLSRAGLSADRVAYDECLLEWILGEHVVVVRPETMTLAEQVGMLEGARGVVGVVGSAFHTLAMTERTPDCLYLCPPWDRDGGTSAALHRLLDADATFEQALEVASGSRRMRKAGIAFPRGYRVLIPRALRALGASVLPALLDDPRIARFARLDDGGGSKDRSSVGGEEIDGAVEAVLREPLSVEARLRLAAAFEAEGLERCAREQLAAVADLGDERVAAVG